MLFLALTLMTVGYAMVYSALHGNWEFWTYFFPKKTATTATGTVQVVSAG